MQRRFVQANVTHDGHPTEAQAKGGEHTIARHFAAIDQDREGYVPEDNIRAYKGAAPCTTSRPPRITTTTVRRQHALTPTLSRMWERVGG
jgi:hypothetical protein